MLYQNSFAGILITFVAASVLVYTFYEHSIPQFKLYWWCAISLVLIVRMAVAIRWYFSYKKANYNPRLAIYQYITGTYITAFFWSAYGVLVLTHSDTLELASSIVIITAMAGGGATILSAHKPTAIAYVLILLVPTSIYLLMEEQSYRLFLGALGLAYTAVMVVGTKNAAEFTAQAIKFKNENAILLDHMEDVVEERTQQIFSLSNIDPLSELLNRTAFLKELDCTLLNAQQSHQSVALLFIDLDGFKQINDTMGHEIGDSVLAKAAHRLKLFCNTEQLLCRWGGDEFLIATYNNDRSGAAGIADQLIDIISKPYSLDGNNLSISATIGISLFPQHTANASQLIQLADTAMYHQKHQQAGKSLLFSEHLSQRLMRTQRLKEGLYEAVELNQLHLCYQPIICAQSGEIVACEALLRWQFENETISPAEFIPIAEQYGLIQKIGSWVLKQACLQASSWSTDCPIRVAVNVSIIQLQDEGFIQIVDDALKESNLAPQLLHVEITESVFAMDKSIILKRIKSLQKRGVKLSIDDFGTEYSSLSIIQDLAVNVIKIDRSFVHKIEGNGLAIINAVMQIAIALNYKVVAEGVENAHQAQQLTGIGVHYLQGFYYSKPIHSEQINQQIGNWEPINQ